MRLHESTHYSNASPLSPAVVGVVAVEISDHNMR